MRNERAGWLLEYLETQRERHEQLLQSALSKRAAIIANDTASVERLTDEECTLLQEVQEAETERRALVEAWGAEYGLGATLRLEDLLAYLEDEGGAIGAARARLREVLDALRRETARNERLLHESLEHIEHFFEALANACEQGRTYNHQGRPARGEQLRLVEYKA